MKYEAIIRYLAGRPWAMEPAALAAMVEIVCARAAGVGASEADLAAVAANQNHGGTPWYAAELDAALAPQTAHAVAKRAGRVAVLPIRGTILHRASGLDAMSGATGLEQLGKTFAGLVSAGDVKAIVLDVDSPGGAVAGLPEFASQVRDARGSKPIVAQVDARAASAAYWIAAQADEIVVTPSGEVGSIGIVTMHDDVSAALEKMGVKRTVIATTLYKAEANPFGPLTDEARAAIEADVAVFDGMFHDAVAEGRGVKPAVVRADFGQGRMVLADEAVRRGMADRTATMEQTLNRFGASMVAGGARAHAQAARATSRMAARRFLRRAELVRR